MTLGDWRVYSAEQGVGTDEVVDLGGAQQLIADLTAADWWNDWFADTPPVEVVLGGAEDPEHAMISSFAHSDSLSRPTKCTISLHPKMLSLRVVLHELAHCAAPSLRSQGVDANGEQWPPTRNPPHGPLFTATLQVITDRCFGDTDNGELLKALKHFEAPIADHDELCTQVACQPDLQRQLQRLYDRAEQERRDSPVPLHIPQFTWGDQFEFSRRDYHRYHGGRLLSQAALAAKISQVHPCTPRHISKIEHSDRAPGDPDQLKRAMLAAIFLGFDPIWTRYTLGLTRWDCGDITLDEARILNAGWADLVEHMNALLEQMPPHWVMEGSR